MQILKGILIAAAVLTAPALAAVPALAAETLIYTGSAFTESDTNPITAPQPVVPALGSRITAIFTIPVAAGYTGTVTTATNWSVFTIGGFTIDPSNGTYELILNLVDGLPASSVGVIADWSFAAFGPSSEQINSVGPPDSGAHDLAGPSKSGSYNLTYTPGVWALAASVPEPGTWVLMLLGLGSLGAVMRLGRRKQLAAA